ncbi:hypothetical protein GCM10023331_29190 [Algivirga pacifica]|uniref:DUF4595 domain-containing protein n=2 Tax=Algivirga pacifica TaxID=1162670 RepID=A0ABP9DED1_9BACT
MAACNQEIVIRDFQNKGHEIIYNMVQKVGDYQMLLEREDVVYTYTYTTADGKEDVSTEKYIFDGELSYGRYEKHERTLPQLEGTIEQGYDGKEYWLKHEGKILTDEQFLKRVAFNRPTNFYWFAMFQKLLDPGLKYEYLGEEEVEGTSYEVVKVTFETTNEKPTDIYQLYVNKETALIDQFLFTVADFGVMEKPYLMKLEYEEVDGMLIPAHRQYKQSTWNAEVNEEPWTKVEWSEIKFKNDLSKAIFEK